MLSGTYHTRRGQEIQFIYLDCIAFDRLAVLDNEAKMPLMGSECQRLRANAASDIDNQRALGEVFPGIPCQFDNWMSNDQLQSRVT